MRRVIGMDIHRTFAEVAALLGPDARAHWTTLRAEGDVTRILTQDDLVQGDNCFFCATGVTDGDLLKGVRFYGGGCTTQSIVMRSKSGTVRMIDGYHRLSKLREQVVTIRSTFD